MEAKPEKSWETITPSHGEHLMRNTGECPNVARESTLSQILQADAPEKYYLSPESLRGDMSQGNEAGKEASADAVGGVDGSVGVECVTLMDAYQHHGWRVWENCGTLTAGQNDSVRGDTPLIVYSFDSLSSNSMKSSNPFSGCRAVEIAKCIDTKYPDPSKNQGGIAVVQSAGFKYGNSAQARSIGYEDEMSPTLSGAPGGNEIPTVIALQANGIDRADTAGCNGCGWRENESYTLNTIDRHAVCYGIDHVITTGGNCTAQGDCIYKDIQATLKAGGVHAVCFENHQHGGYKEGCGTLRACGGDYGGGSENLVCYDARGNGDGETLCFNEAQITSPTNGNNPQWNEPCHTISATDNRAPTVIINKPPRKYIIRRLTPTECARLQGFPDNWGHLAPYDSDTEFLGRCTQNPRRDKRQEVQAGQGH